MTTAPRPPAMHHLACRDDGDVRVLDLSRCRWVDPAHLVGAAAIAQRCADTGRTLRLVSPANPEQRRYAGRMHLGQVLTRLGVQHDLPQVLERDRSEDLLEVRAVATEDDARALAALVRGKVAGADVAAAQALFAGVAEMALNVADHAGAVGYVAAQTLPSSGWVRFAVADGGTGLLRSLFQRGALTHRQAALMALSGASRFDEPDRGTGLPTTARELSALRGFLYVVSGTATVRVSDAGTAPGRLETPYAGTLVEGVVALGGR